MGFDQNTQRFELFSSAGAIRNHSRMCGILGFILSKDVDISKKAFAASLDALYKRSETRGRDASGIALQANGSLLVHREAQPASKMIRSTDYRAIVSRAYDTARGKGVSQPLVAIGHARLVTNGLQAIDLNNQPVISAGRVVIHNGIVVNHDELWQKVSRTPRLASVDTEIIGALLADYEEKTGSLIEASRALFHDLVGEASIAVLFDDRNVLLLATNTGSLYAARRQDGKGFFFVSEQSVAEALTGADALEGFAKGDLHQVAAGEALILDLDTLEETRFFLRTNAPIAAPAIEKRISPSRQIENRFLREQEARTSLRRCTRCVLPETMPFIAFDVDGVCNYCHSYRRAPLKGSAALERYLEKFRRSDSAPDSLVAFSGGRDSSYGLHVLVKDYGLKPMAYTYDWGMVTDLARRNQARMCGQLGIEHIWVSADIKAKRDNIRRNVEAWMHRPNLGIIPLFMAGDKKAYAYANDLMDKSGLHMMAFCSNKLEKTDFKTGFCGIAPNPEQDQPFSLDVKRKLMMLAYYAGQYCLNPRYLNRSMLDTFQGFVSLYYKERDYLYLFDYLDWNEDEINRTLIETYEWETSPDTNTTWRIGDGSASFYNFVYYTVAGFTEHDTFRSNQIREGKIGREAALISVEQENQPRWESLRDYCRTVDVDFDALVKTVSAMPKLYGTDSEKRFSRNSL